MNKAARARYLNREDFAPVAEDLEFTQEGRDTLERIEQVRHPRGYRKGRRSR